MISYRYTFTGALELSARKNGDLVKMQYIGWDLSTAKKLFTASYGPFNSL